MKTLRNEASPFRVVLAYLLFGSVWIFFSDRLLYYVIIESGELTVYQTYKGVVFVLLTSALLFLILKRSYKKILNLYEAKLNRGQEIKALKERLDFLLNSTPAVLYSAKPSVNFEAVFVSENIRHITGFVAEEFVSDPSFWMNHIHPDDKRIINDAITELLQKDRHSYEYRFRRKDGSYTWLNDEMRLIRDADGKPLEITGNWFDIAERKRAEEKLRESEENLERAQAIAHIGSWRFDVSTDTLEGSAETHRIFGVPPGTPFSFELFLSHIHPDDREFVETSWKAALRGVPYEIDYRIMVNDEIKWVKEWAEVHFDADFNALYGIGMVQDITERKLKELKLQENEARLREAEEIQRRLNDELEARVMDRTAELMTKNSELERMNKLFVGRELKMKELKAKIKESKVGSAE